MSTYLQLCSQLRQEATDIGTGPTAVTGQSGELQRFVTWIADFYTELQQQKPWRWLHSYFTVSATSGDGVYAYGDCTDDGTSAAITRFAFWYKNEFKCYLASSGVGAEYPLIWLPWEQFRRKYRYGTQNNAPPVHVSADNSDNMVLGPVPDATYTVSGGYQKGPQVLAADGDTPEMPSKFHKYIVYGALTKYGGNRVATEAIVRALSEGGPLRAALIREQLPEIRLGASAA